MVIQILSWLTQHGRFGFVVAHPNIDGFGEVSGSSPGNTNVFKMELTAPQPVKSFNFQKLILV